MRHELGRREVVVEPRPAPPWPGSRPAWTPAPPPMPIGVIVIARSSSAARPAAEPTPAGGAGCRMLLPEPGVWRVVRWGEFKPTLAPQIAHPERLHDTHRLACHAQVYEITKPQPVAALASALLGPDQPPQLLRLTPALAARLELVPLLAPRRNRGRVMPAQPGLVLPDERLVRLRVATDPTRTPATPLGRAPAPDAVAVAPPARPRTAIPERFVKPWEFRLSREEAVYDMQAAAPRFPALAGWLERVAGWWRGRDELTKWHTLLAGKSRDEQLWGVRPPRGGLSRPAVRAWATRVLELAGYDPRPMLPEWEIFWRRKGL
jgi:hypothetical protein